MALSMFGRRGTYLIKAFTTIALLSVSLFGFDQARVMLTYLAFASLFQRELEAPTQNEVDELDDMRSIFGILIAMLVTLTLLPMP